MCGMCNSSQADVMVTEDTTGRTLRLCTQCYNMRALGQGFSFVMLLPTTTPAVPPPPNGNVKATPACLFRSCKGGGYPVSKWQDSVGTVVHICSDIACERIALSAGLTLSPAPLQGVSVSHDPCDNCTSGTATKNIKHPMGPKTHDVCDKCH